MNCRSEWLAGDIEGRKVWMGPRDGNPLAMMAGLMVLDALQTANNAEMPESRTDGIWKTATVVSPLTCTVDFDRIEE